MILTPGSEIPVGLVKGGMRAPGSDVPCVFVGPGTGIAPMRALIEQRIHQRSKSMLSTVLSNDRQPSCIWKS